MPRRWRETRTSKGRTVQSCYELPHRVHVVKTYPVTEELGATAVVYGHETGLTVIWRGGQSMEMRQRAQEVANGEEKGRKSDGGGKAAAGSEGDGRDTNESIIHHLDIQLMTTVVDIAFPDIPPPTSLPGEDPPPHIFGQSIILVAACANNKVYAIRCPLRPERTITPRDEYDMVRMAHLELTGKPYNVAATWTAAEDLDEVSYELTTPDEFAPQDPSKQYDLLVAIATGEAIGRIVFVRLPLVFPQTLCFPCDEQFLQHQVISLTFSPASYPSERHSQLLIAHPDGYVSVYDSLLPRRRWLASFATAFEAKSVDDSTPALLDRKRLLSAQWVANGQSVIALLEDGEWGIWDCPTAFSKSSNTPFVLHGYTSHHTAAPHVNSKDHIPPRGGIAVLKTVGNSAAAYETEKSQDKSLASDNSAEESVILWYKDRIYNIPCLRRFRVRAVKDVHGGSLYGSGLTRIDGAMDLHNEILTSAAQLYDRHSCKLVLSTEKKLLFLSPSTSNLSSSTPPRGAFTFEIPFRGVQLAKSTKIGFPA